MAGIGFELKRLLDRQTYGALAQAYAYAGVISAGPWVLSILAILSIGMLSATVVEPPQFIREFQVSVTYVMVGSLITSGVAQLAFTRFCADRVFERDNEAIAPNLNGMLCIVVASSGLVGIGLALVLFPAQSNLYRALMIAGFAMLNAIWTTTALLSGLRRYFEIIGLYLIGYAITLSAALAMRPLGLEGLLLGFVAGHAVLLTGQITLVMREYPAARFVAFDFLRRDAILPSLVACGVLFHLAVWADKLMFWAAPQTGQAVIGPLRAAPAYDQPLFLAYLAIIPGMAVFLLEIETQIAPAVKRYFDAIRNGEPIRRIETLRDEVTYAIRGGLFEIVKVQSIAVLVIFAAGPWLADRIEMPSAALPLLYVDVIAASLQVLLLAIVTILHYLDRRRAALGILLLCLILNVILTSASLTLGPAYYGYGFALALIAADFAGMIVLQRRVERLEYETFMLQRPHLTRT